MKKSHSNQLINVDPNDIDFDVNNPRGEKEETITNDPGFRSLTESIKQYGILEPIIIKVDSKNKSRYVLVDGERRLRAAKLILLSSIPALLIHKDLDGSILAYHVHMLRQQWGKAAETKSIKRIIKVIESEHPDLSENDIKKKIKEITKAPSQRILDLYILTKYEDKYIDLVAQDVLDISYLIQGQNSFINKVKNKFPELLTDYPEEVMRTILAEKSLNNKVPGTRFWMDTFKDVFTNDPHKEEIKTLLIEFFDDPDISASEIYNKFDKLIHKNNNGSFEKEVLTIFDNAPCEGKSAASSNSIISNDSHITATNNPFLTKKDKPTPPKKSLDFAHINLTPLRQTSINNVRPKFERIGSTFSNEENEYVKESLHCLNEQCFKAAILMIWATAISRILKYISKDIADFNNCSKEMKGKKDSFSKHYSGNFQCDAQTIDEIRVASKDTQLLCYITHKNIIDETQFKKLKGHFDIRNDCAHPTLINLKVNETVAIFENILEFILNNPKLR